MAEKIEYTIDINTKLAENAINDLNDEIGGVGDRVASNNNKTSQSFGTLPGPVGKATGAVQLLNAGFKALLANPVVLVITAIVGALALLFKAFTSTKEGGEKLNQIMAGLGAAFDVVRDLAVTLGKSLMSLFEDPKQALLDFANLIKQNIINRFEGLLELIPNLGKAIGKLFRGEFKEAGQIALDAVAKVSIGVDDLTNKATQAFEAVGEVVKEAINEAKVAANIEKTLQRVTDAERNLTIERAKQNKEIAKARLLAEDEKKSLEERMEAVRRAAELEQQLADKELSVARQRAAAIQQRNALSDSSAEALDEEAQAIAAVFQLETDSLNKRKRLSTELEALKNEYAANEKARIKEQEEAEKARLEAIEQRMELEKQMLEEEKKANEEAINEMFEQEKLNAIKTIENEQELSDALEQIELDRLERLIQERQDYGDKTTDLEIKQAEKIRAEKKKNLDKELADQKALEEAKVNLLNAGFAAIQSLVGADTKWGKAVAVTSAIIDTYRAINKTLAAGGALAIPAAAVVGVQGFANVKNILGEKVPSAPLGSSGGGSAGSAPSIGPSVGIVNSQIDSGTQIAQTLNNALNKPPKAYVVSQNVTTGQSLDRHIDQNATIGG